MTKYTKAQTRLLDFLMSNGSCGITTFGGDGQIFVQGNGAAKMLATDAMMEELRRAELIDVRNDRIGLTATGHAACTRRRSAPDEAFSAQHRAVETQRIRLDHGLQDVRINRNESPLSRLHARKAGDGRRWISDAGFAAGERLRRDFDFGNLQQKVTSSWDPTSGGSGKGRGGKQDLSDNAIDARRRMGDALDAVGPDLAGLMTDVCCHLKGLELVERERRWPPRSAKLLLRVGLDLLASHYGTHARSTARGIRTG